ncbi:hypothetical protein [Microbacterium aoyamense]|uniref:hypothetical protein n=1 Tax=Microbacterium aoyamense TaxID=344166 RepID=UPI00200385D5|nr:hypothetical protein [Microbacterium aoyamense]
MWRVRAARRAALISAAVLVAACIGWAALAQTATIPACDLPTPPSNVGTLTCPTHAP